MENRREKIRIHSLNIIDYSCLNKDGKVIETSMGRTLNVSAGGILIETHIPIPAMNAVCIDIGLKEEVVEINGLVKYCKQTENKMFQSGIEFLAMDEAAHAILNNYIEAFNKQQ